MPSIKLVNISGESVGELNLSDVVFDVPLHIPAMHQVVVAQLANRRQGNACAKNRGEVRGGGKKPWRQKHTGRARHGSSRSPIWVGGGVVHGPKPRSYRQKVNKKVRKLAICSALSQKVRDAQVFGFQSFAMEAPSTKAMKVFFQALGAVKPLVILDSSDMNVTKSARNIPGARVMHVDSINVYDLLKHGHIVMSAGAVKKLEEVYA
ncbi:MAG: 50S ribosomal protein L4 [Synergistales bacterium]|nr:50S ribosomal protein L4 [Dethiosulfovibrio sp.]NCC95890.1 50S ribosomal protein L4 [Synergistales bacterium]